MSRHEWETEGTAHAANIIGGLIRAWDTEDIARSWKVLVFVTAFCAECGKLHSFSMFEFDKDELYEAVGTSVTAFKIAQRIKELLLELLDTSATFDVSSLNLIQAPSD